jgi:hypothetical protein
MKLLLAALIACSEQGFYTPVPPIYDINNAPTIAVTPVVDRIMQFNNKTVDVLWVIDNSCSMAPYQSRLQAAFPRAGQRGFEPRTL